MSTAPLSRGDKIAELVDLGFSEDTAAQHVDEKAARDTELAQTTDPKVLLPAIRDGLKLSPKLEHIAKSISTPAHYRMDFDIGSVPLGPSSMWATRPSVFAALFLDHLGEMPAVPTGDRRRELFGMIARAAVPEDIGDDATDDGWTRGMLREYLGQRPATDTVEEAAASENPFHGPDGRVCMFGPAFTRWLLLTYQDRVSRGDLGRRLRAVGCEPDKINHGKGTDRTTRGIWRLPVTLDV